MEFDISRLVISAMLMWGDDEVDVISANSPKNCALLTNDNITEFCLKTTLSSMIPSVHMGRRNRNLQPYNQTAPLHKIFKIDCQTEERPM